MTPKRVVCATAALVDGLGNLAIPFAAEQSKLLAPTRGMR